MYIGGRRLDMKSRQEAGRANDETELILLSVEDQRLIAEFLLNPPNLQTLCGVPLSAGMNSSAPHECAPPEQHHISSFHRRPA